MCHNSQSCTATSSLCVGRSCTCDQDASDGGSLLLVLQGLEDSAHYLGLQVARQPALEKACVHPGPLPRPVSAPQWGVHCLPCLHHTCLHVVSQSCLLAISPLPPCRQTPAAMLSLAAQRGSTVNRMQHQSGKCGIPVKPDSGH